MLVALPIISFVLIMLCLVVRGSDYRQAFLGAAVCYGLLVTAATELLSLFNAITYLTLAVFWVVAIALALGDLLSKRTHLKIQRPRIEAPVILAGIAVVLATTLLIAIVSPPNNWDSMTYHMARVVHWIQNRSVAHYPTHITRQLFSGPWAEYAILHLQILSGGDRFANLVQWFAMCGCIVGASAIAREFNASSRIQTLAAALAASLPMGILQASSTQDDYVVAFSLVCFVYFGMLLVRTPTLFIALACGSSLGLSMLNKGTAYIFAFPFIIWLLSAGLKTNRHKFLKSVIVVGVIAVSLNAGYFWRNYALWGSPLTTDQDKLTNDRISLTGTLSNVTRNIASNTWTPFASVNLLQFQGVKLVHDLLGIDINDPATTLSEAFTPGMTSLDEDYAGNGLHLILALAAVGFLALRRKSLPQALTPYALSLAGSGLLFCMLLKWQPWGTRLELPLFVLAAPLTALALPLGNRRWAVTTLAAIMLLCSIPWLFSNQTRPLWGEQSILGADRESLYFAKRPQLLPYYLQAAEYAGNRFSCNAIGLVSSNGNTYEYPFWALLSKRRENMPRIEHVNVANISGSIPLKNFSPCMTLEIH
jgi:hypothetical protein